MANELPEKITIQKMILNWRVVLHVQPGIEVVRIVEPADLGAVIQAASEGNYEMTNKKVQG